MNLITTKVSENRESSTYPQVVSRICFSNNFNGILYEI